MTEPPARASPAPDSRAAAGGTALLTLGLILVAASLRPVATSVGPLLTQIRASLHLGGATAGLLATVPTLCFGAFAPLAPLLSRRFGIARTLAAAVAAIVAGLLLRVGGGAATLFVGTILAASGAACGNVLLPVIVRRSYPGRIGRISALYTTSLSAVAALAAGLTVPLAHAIGRGWRGGLAVWTLPAAVALACWLPQLRARRLEPARQTPDARVRDVTRDPLTWQLTLFFALQSASFYSMVAWMPSIFQSHGFSATAGGLLLGLSSIVAAPAALATPWLAARWRGQGRLAFCLTGLIAVGYAGLLAAPAAAPELWAVLIGSGQGASFALALTMIVLRSGSPGLTTSVSTHVQSIGYLLAAAGPIAIGAVHDAAGAWSAPLAVLIALLVPQALMGLGAGRPRVIAATAATALA